jgi:hypothetical protein
MLSFGLEKANTVEVIAAYSAPQTVVPAVSASPGWHVIGTFFLPKTVRARLDALIQVSQDGVTARVRLFDLQTLAPVSGVQVQSTSTLPERKLSPLAELTGNRRYQIQAEAVAAAPDEETFAVISTASITD